MHFYNLIKEISKEDLVSIYVDMDGVIACYDIGKPFDYIEKRPLKTNINTLHKISELENVQLNILSICRKDKQIIEKNIWLDENAPFFKLENRFILSKETIKDLKSPQMKADFLKALKDNRKHILIDDDNMVLKEVGKIAPEVILYQDSEMVD